MTETNSTSNLRKPQIGFQGNSRTLTKYAAASLVIIASMEAIFAALCVLAHVVL